MWNTEEFSENGLQWMTSMWGICGFVVWFGANIFIKKIENKAGSNANISAKAKELTSLSQLFVEIGSLANQK